MANLASAADTWLQGSQDDQGVWAYKKKSYIEAISKAYTPHDDLTHAELELSKAKQIITVADYTEHFKAI
ncbi:hypothetical protein GGI08_002750, partial [Coemansia sp. S2]